MYRALAAALDAIRRHCSSAPIVRPAARTCDARRGCFAAAAMSVLSPTEDGGYALIGAPHFVAAVRRHRLGEGGVYAQTATRLRDLGYRWRALRRVWTSIVPRTWSASIAPPCLAQPQVFRR